MAVRIDFKPIANGGGANVVDQTTYETLLNPGGALQNGYQAGTAESAQVNKSLRQSSVMAAAIAQMISDALGGADVIDDGVVATLATQLKAALITSAWSTGDAKLTYKTVADAGWIMADDGTVGSAASGANHAADANQALFLLLWNNFTNAWAPVVGGRGANAPADWAANKKITLPKSLGRAIAIAGTGAGLTARALGEALGSENAVLMQHNHGINISDPTHAHGTVVTDPGHFHYATQGGSVAAGSGGTPAMLYSPGQQVSTEVTGISVGVSASGTGISATSNNAGVGETGVGKNMQPSAFFNAMVKL